MLSARLAEIKETVAKCFRNVLASFALQRSTRPPSCIKECLLLREERGGEGWGEKGWGGRGREEGVVREGGICVIGFRGMDSTGIERSKVGWSQDQ